MFANGIKGGEIILLLIVLLLLFGAKRLPDAARGIGRSLRIFKAETKGLRDDERDEVRDTFRAEPRDDHPTPAPAPLEIPAATTEPAVTRPVAEPDRYDR
ncbi:MAG TPA: Sec-independent protein translocase subunit TatA [Actinomycetes bacterium]|nr:Sec-independent protein translocase subunit TatA [Actinomycetes bacterium]